MATSLSCSSLDRTRIYITTIEKEHDFIIAIPQSEPDPFKVIKSKLDEHGMFEKFKLWGDFNQLYTFCEGFISYVNKQKDESFRKFIPVDYEIIENEEYAEYQKKKEIDKAMEKAANDVLEKFGIIPTPETKSKSDSEPQIEFTTDSTPTDTPFSISELPNYNYEKDIYSRIVNLLKLSDSKTMLFLFGFFLTNSVLNRSENKHHYSLCLVSKKQEYVKKLCDLLFRIFFKDEKHPSTCFDSSKQIKDYFKSCTHYFPVISTDNEFNKSDRKHFSSALTKYYENKPNKLKEGLIIISEKSISCKYIHNLDISTNDPLEAEKIIIDLKSYNDFNKTVEDFLNNLKTTYSDRTLCIYDKVICEDNNKELIKHELSQKEESLSHNSMLTLEESIMFTPVVYFLEKYFEFLLLSHAVTEEEYISLNNKIKEMYSNDCVEEINTPSTDKSEPTTEEISEILLGCITEAYATQKIPADETKDFYIYANHKKNHSELICFRHEQSSPLKCIIDLIEEAGMQDKIADIKELALSSAIGDNIKKLWKNSDITCCTHGYLYSMGDFKVIALTSEALKPYLKN